MDASTNTGTQQETRIFVSYAREDAKWLDKNNPHSLIPYLVESLHRHNVTFWFDKELKGGDVFERHIATEIDNSQIALLIVSQCFLNSEFIENKEMPRIAERAKQGKMIVVPVLVEPCDWSDYSFLADRQMVPGPMPLIEYTESEAKWAKVKFQILDGLKAQVKRMSDGPQVMHVQPPMQIDERGIQPSLTIKGPVDAEAPPLPPGASEKVKLYHFAANNGDALAQYNLGVLLAIGSGVTQDKAEAARWYSKAANQGNAAAQRVLGSCYASGSGIVQDKAEAVRWYRKAADQGDVEAQFHLGHVYENGEGVEINRAEAVRWYRKADEQGYIHARQALVKLAESTVLGKLIHLISG